MLVRRRLVGSGGFIGCEGRGGGFRRVGHGVSSYDVYSSEAGLESAGGDVLVCAILEVRSPDAVRHRAMPYKGFPPV